MPHNCDGFRGESLLPAPVTYSLNALAGEEKAAIRARDDLQASDAVRASWYPARGRAELINRMPECESEGSRFLEPQSFCSFGLRGGFGYHGRPLFPFHSFFRTPNGALRVWARPVDRAAYAEHVRVGLGAICSTLKSTQELRRLPARPRGEMKEAATARLRTSCS